MTSHRRLALVLAVVALAGCNGFLAGGSGESTRTLSPAPVPTEAAPVPPGVADGRLVDPQALLSAHAARTAETAYTGHRTRVERRVDGAVRARTEATARRASDGRYRVTVTATGTVADRTEYFFDGSAAYLAADFGDRTAYARAFTGHGSAPLPQDLLYFGTAPYRGGVENQRGLFRYVAAANGSTVAVDRPTAERDRFRYTIRTDRVADTVSFADQEGVLAVENVTVAVRFDRRGFVRRYEVAYTGRTRDGRVAVRETVAYTNVGSTTVERPDWPILGD